MTKAEALKEALEILGPKAGIDTRLVEKPERSDGTRDVLVKFQVGTVQLRPWPPKLIVEAEGWNWKEALDALKAKKRPA